MKTYQNKVKFRRLLKFLMIGLFKRVISPSGQQTLGLGGRVAPTRLPHPPNHHHHVVLRKIEKKPKFSETLVYFLSKI